MSKMLPPNKALSAICRCFHILSTRFHNLSTIYDWIELYRVLCVKSGIDYLLWDRKSLPLSFHETVTRTVLLFQALTPIRLGFIDGQARMTSVAHFLHNILPKNPVEFPLLPLFPAEELPTPLFVHASRLSKVSRSVTLNMLLPCATGDNPAPFTDVLVSSLVRFSDEIQENINMAQARSLKDAVLHFLSKMKAGELLYSYVGANNNEVGNILRTLYTIRADIIADFLRDSSPDCKLLFAPLKMGKSIKKGVNWDNHEEIVPYILGYSGTPSKHSPLAEESPIKGKKMEGSVLRNKGIPSLSERLRIPADLAIMVVMLSECTYSTECIQLFSDLLARDWNPRDTVKSLLDEGDSFIQSDVLLPTVSSLRGMLLNIAFVTLSPSSSIPILRMSSPCPTRFPGTIPAMIASEFFSIVLCMTFSSISTST